VIRKPNASSQDLEDIGPGQNRYGRLTGKARVAIVTSGPGVTNLVTGLATAHSEGDPVVALGGAVAVADRLKSVHQTMDSVSVCRPVTKYSAEIDSPAATAEMCTKPAFCDLRNRSREPGLT
jgi:thiamine pyrophosphate-dependent acetolactate synthase large subunit-like protein